MCRSTLVSMLIGLAVSQIASLPLRAEEKRANETWVQNLREALPTLGHRNWIVIADMAYPAQSREGVETRYIGGDQLSAVKSVLNEIERSPHVRANVLVDSELEFVPEGDARGISQYRSGLSSALRSAKTQRLPHEEIIKQLDESAKTFRVLIFKTDMTIPYTSVFIQLDCGYWSEEAEQRLRAAMSRE